MDLPNVKIDSVKLINIFDKELQERNATMSIKDTKQLITLAVLKTIDVLTGQFETEFAFILKNLFDDAVEGKELD